MRSSQVLWKNNDDCSDIHHLPRHGHLLSFRVSSLEKTFLKNVIIIIIMVVVVVVVVVVVFIIIIIIIIIIIVVNIAIIIIVVVVVIFIIIVSKIIIVVIIIFIYITGVRSVIYGADFFTSRCLIGLPSLLTFTDFKSLKNVKKTLYLNLLSKIS